MNIFTDDSIRVTLGIYDLREADQYVESAKSSLSNHTFHTEWMKFTQKISSPNPFKTFVVLFSVLPALSQIVQSLNLDYHVTNCYEASNPNEPLGLGKCIVYNEDSLVFSKNHLEISQLSTFYKFITLSLTDYLIFYCFCYILLNRNKYLVKMLGVGVKITQVFSKSDFALLFVFLTNVSAACFFRYQAQSLDITRSCTGPNGSHVDVNFQVSLSSGTNLMAGLQMAMLFSCFLILVYKFHKDPISSFVTLKNFIDNAQMTGFNMNSIKYTVNYGKSLEIIKAFFSLYKKKEEETVILIAALEYFKDRKMVIEDEKIKTEGTEGGAMSAPLLINKV